MIFLVLDTASACLVTFLGLVPINICIVYFTLLGTVQITLMKLVCYESYLTVCVFNQGYGLNLITTESNQISLTVTFILMFLSNVVYEFISSVAF